MEGELHVADGVNHIGEGAFYSCVNLTSVTLPEGVTESTESGKTPDKIEEEQVPAAVTEDTTDSANNTGLIVIITACAVIAVSVISVVIKHKKS